MPDTAAPTSGEPISGGDGGDASAHAVDDVQEYLDATRRIVEEGAPELTTIVAGIADSLSAGDSGAVAALFAPDEAAGPRDVPEVLGALPPGAQVLPPESVEVFAVDEATVYFVYCLASWRDGGIESEHTMVVPLRFVDGEWRLTTIDERVDGLVPVQVVEL
jgi:hypothetical protein